ncbi:MAG: serine--tRNA ligase [Rickettsiales bacterium]|nr:serine--tRNA ligase [Rickettsiales bacterium]
MKEVTARRDEYAAAIRNKNVKLDLDRLVSLYEQFLEADRRLQDLNSRKNRLSEAAANASPAEKPAIIEESRRIGAEVAKLSESMKAIEPEYKAMLWLIPNIPAPDAPIGKDDSENVVVKKAGAPRKFDFPILPHYDLLLKNDWADFERASKVSGTRSYILKGAASRLEIALHAFVMDKLTQKGFTMITVPSMAFESALFGTGHFPFAREDVYKVGREENGAIADENMWLSGTAEIILTSLHGGEILDEQKLPILYAGYSPCFRREAGAAGKDTRGLVRVHQFMKVEQYVICRNDIEESAKWHKVLLQCAEEVLSDLELPYRVIECCTGDMGAGKYKMNDLEAWMPSQDKYRETHSCSTMTDWQARRANLRYRENGTNKARFCHTLNNTGIATPRIMAQILENHQTADGRVRLPEKIRPYMNGKEWL